MIHHLIIGSSSAILLIKIVLWVFKKPENNSVYSTRANPCIFCGNHTGHRNGCSIREHPIGDKP